MKVTCPSCQSAYRLPDERLPATGARIKCPKCSHAFVVRPGAPAPDPAPPSPSTPSPPSPARSDEQATPLHDHPVGSTELATPLNALTDSPGPPPKTAPPPDERGFGVSAIRAQSNPSMRQEPYRVRIPGGLTYDFGSLSALRRWLTEQTDLAATEVAAPGQGWSPAAGFLPEEVDQSKPLELSRPAVALPPDATLQRDMKPRPRLEERDEPKASPLLWSAILLSALLVAGLTAGTLTRYGIVNLAGFLPLDRFGIVFPEPTAVVAVDSPPPVDGETMYREALQTGRRALVDKRFSKAALEFKRALSVHAGSVEALTGLSEALIGIGDLDRAREVLDQVRSIKGSG